MEDPREELITTLLEAVQSQGTIVAYSNYESRVLKSLALAFPQWEERLLDLCERLVDLHKLVRECYYHPEMRGSFSIKAVLPVLVPDLGYDDLDIGEGRAAAAAFAHSIAADTPEDECAAIRESLLAYCKRDTEAMVRVYEALVAKVRLGTISSIND